MTSERSEEIPIVSPQLSDSQVLLILLGASNLSRGCFAFSRYMKACLYPRPVEVLIASGPGRGYYASGGLLNVNYPPICSSEIFEVAHNKSRSGAQVIALVTDIGNDIMYGVSTEKLIETIQQTFSRLQSINAEIFYTTLPIAFEKEVNPIWFYVFRSLLFPYSRVSFDEATGGIIATNKFLRGPVSENLHLISDMNCFLGYDEIHYGWLRAHRAWSHVAKVMLEIMGIEVAKEITLSKMLQSYWKDLQQVVCADMMGFQNKNPEHY